MEYTDVSFTQRKKNPFSQKENPEEELLGPLLKGKINDEIHVSQMFSEEEELNSCGSLHD